jgi:glycosyltransferase 2 family protein
VTKIIRIAVSVALVGWVAWNTNWAEVGAAFARLRLDLWLAAVGLLGVTQLVSAVRWQVITRALGFGRPLRQLTGIYFIGMYFNLLLPTSVGGDVVRAWYLDGGSGRRLAAFATVFLDRLSGLLVLLGMACVALALSPLDNLPPWVSLFVWGTTGAALVGLAVLPVFVGRGRQGASRRERLGTALAAIRSPRVLLSTTLMSLWVQAANVVVVWLLGLSIGAPVPGAYYWIMVPMVSLLTMLPVSVNGIGVRDKGTALFLAPLGVREGTALTLAFLWLLVYTVTSLTGGFVYLFGHFPRPATSAEMAEEAAPEEPPAAEARRAAA